MNAARLTIMASQPPVMITDQITHTPFWLKVIGQNDWQRIDQTISNSVGILSNDYPLLVLTSQLIVNRFLLL